MDDETRIFALCFTYRTAAAAAVDSFQKMPTPEAIKYIFVEISLYHDVLTWHFQLE